MTILCTLLSKNDHAVKGQLFTAFLFAAMLVAASIMQAHGLGKGIVAKAWSRIVKTDTNFIMRADFCGIANIARSTVASVQLCLDKTKGPPDYLCTNNFATERHILS
ncbi:hypothetical protein [Pseudorhodoplanes sinuspersici]|uniref:Uncharacterized protein n=1 Tax=Pseudorhodoplanes sinuspersici TaxID=1235591 RepID=A0A1W6ZYR9_9HYPH|nr:hypothetical protein [Pseudorhodoplanes sinuspersici]ARQ02474.1 hypothetical protein CAK95_27705 [Pseudorhodoplanes sinuspersici]RKE74313.1 hypothetical protein DFP91_2217 [Pseudorhodoplanes sinuspersici]